MLLRQALSEMPSTTVVLDLISRTGSPTKYSLSPFHGMRNILSERTIGQMENSGEILANLVRWKDDFTFIHSDFVYSLYHKDKDLAEMGYIDMDDFQCHAPNTGESKKNRLCVFDPYCGLAVVKYPL